MVGQEKIFQNKGSQKARKCYFQSGFSTNSISKESHIANLLSRIHRNCARHSFASRVYYGSTMVGPGEKFSKSKFSFGWKMLF